MRLCFIAHQGTKEGAGLFMLDQIDYLQRHGETVFAILPEGGKLREALETRGVETAIVPSAWWIRPRWLESDADYAGALSAARQMAVLFRQWSIDVAYTQTVVAPAGALGAALAGIPHVWHIHEFSYNPGAIEMGLPKRALARLIDLTSNVVFFNSKAVASEWSGLFRADKTRVVYNWTSLPVDDGPPTIADELAVSLLGDETTSVVAIVGSIVRWKRQMDAVRAVGNLLNDRVDVALLVVGPAVDPAYQRELIDVVEQNGWASRIRFVGYSEHPHRIMRAASVCLVCSDNEPFGRVTVESMAQGTPVIGTNAGGTAEIIEDGVDGLLFPTGDVVGLTDRLGSVIRDEGLRARLAEGAKEKSKRFQGPESVMSPVQEILARLVGDKNPSWPLGTVIDTGISGAAALEPPVRGLAQRGKRLLQELRRGI